MNKRTHEEAWQYPHLGFELTIVCVYDAIEYYARSHLEHYSSTIGNDPIASRSWKEMARALLNLLNGEIGDFDRYEVQKKIHDLAKKHDVALYSSSEILINKTIKLTGDMCKKIKNVL